MEESKPYTIWVEDCPHGNHIYHYKVNDFEFKNEMMCSDCPECKCIRIYKLKNYVAEYEDGYKIVADIAYLLVDSDYGQCITVAYDENDDHPLVRDMHWSVHLCNKYDVIYIIPDEKFNNYIINKNNIYPSKEGYKNLSEKIIEKIVEIY